MLYNSEPEYIACMVTRLFFICRNLEGGTIIVCMGEGSWVEHPAAPLGNSWEQGHTASLNMHSLIIAFYVCVQYIVLSQMCAVHYSMKN